MFKSRVIANLRCVWYSFKLLKWIRIGDLSQAEMIYGRMESKFGPEMISLFPAALANAFRRDGNYERASVYYHKAIYEVPGASTAEPDQGAEVERENPETKDMREHYAHCLYALGRYTDALREYEILAREVGQDRFQEMISNCQASLANE